HTTDRTERDRFNQELHENVAPVRADRHARTDLACPLSYAYEHDVHDPDSADHERHAGNRAKQYRHDCSRRGRRICNLLLITHREIVIATGANVMPLS